MAMRGDWNSVWANPTILSLSKGQRRKAKGSEGANDLGDDLPGAGEPDMFGDAAAAE